MIRISSKALGFIIVEIQPLYTINEALGIGWKLILDKSHEILGNLSNESKNLL